MSRIKLSYVVATPELMVNENVTAYQGDIEEAFIIIKTLGYDGVELMAVDPQRIDWLKIQNLANKYELEIPVICTGEVFGQECLSFMDPDRKIREKAISRMNEIIDFAKYFEAHVNIGRIRGHFYPDIPKEKSVGWMYDAFDEITEYALNKGVVLILEPIPYIFCNNINSTLDGLEVVKKVNKDSFKLMIDFFSINMEDKSVEKSFEEAKTFLKHIHICDSNRLAPGYGNLDFQRLINIIKKIDYSGYLSVEIKQFPDKDTILKDSIELIKPLID